MNKSDMIARIREMKEEARTAGPIHRRDLNKNIRRMERELCIYNRFQEEARRK